MLYIFGGCHVSGSLFCSHSAGYWPFKWHKSHILALYLWTSDDTLFRVGSLMICFSRRRRNDGLGEDSNIMICAISCWGNQFGPFWIEDALYCKRIVLVCKSISCLQYSNHLWMSYPNQLSITYSSLFLYLAATESDVFDSSVAERSCCSNCGSSWKSPHG